MPKKQTRCQRKPIKAVKFLDDTCFTRHICNYTCLRKSDFKYSEHSEIFYLENVCIFDKNILPMLECISTYSNFLNQIDFNDGLICDIESHLLRELRISFSTDLKSNIVT